MRKRGERIDDAVPHVRLVGEDQGVGSEIAGGALEQQADVRTHPGHLRPEQAEREIAILAAGEGQDLYRSAPYHSEAEKGERTMVAAPGDHEGWSDPDFAAQCLKPRQEPGAGLIEGAGRRLLQRGPGLVDNRVGRGTDFHPREGASRLSSGLP